MGKEAVHTESVAVNSGRTWLFTEWRPRSAGWQFSRLGRTSIGELNVSRMSAPRILAILFLCVTAALADSDKTTLRKIWASDRYTTNSIPAAWRPAKLPVTATDVRVFEGFSLQAEGLSITNFIAKYGLPQRYLTTKRKHDGDWDYLIYDLPSGHSVALYVPKPPGWTFGACVIITSDDSLVRLIK